MTLIDTNLVTTIISSCESKRESICNYRVEPSIGEVITHISPRDFVPFIHTMTKSKVTSKNDMSGWYPILIVGAISDNSFNVLSSIMNSSIPLRLLMSYGKYSLGTSKAQSKIFPLFFLCKSNHIPKEVCAHSPFFQKLLSVIVGQAK